MPNQYTYKDISIEDVKSSDIEIIVAIEKEAFTLLLPQDTYSDALNDDKAFFKKAILNGQIVGYILGSFTDFEGEVIELAVSEEYQKMGIATMLLSTFEHFLNNGKREYLYLEVHEKNLKAISLYEKNGFTIYNVRKKYYRDLGSAYLYRKKLSI